MTRHDLTRDWTVESDRRPAVRVDLPHDAMIGERRERDCRNGGNTGYYPGGRYTYRKRFTAPSEWAGHRVSLLFEGAYHRSEVTLNGSVVGGRPSGYAEFYVDLDEVLVAGTANELAVVVDTSGEPNSRWYSGSGLYRRVWLDVDGPVRIARDGLRTRTLWVADPAQVEIEVTVDRAEGHQTRDVETVIELVGADGEVVATAGPGGEDASCEVRATLEVPEPRLWSAESPALYELVVRLQDGHEVLDEQRRRIGIRSVVVSPGSGLRVNDRPVLLRGGCVHHDSGVLGAATFRAAELRRARILKDAGFNAIRAGHSPIGRDLLDACDEVGLYVVDELTDVWSVAKTTHDYARDFGDWWRADLRSMVAKSRNHASVIMYSIGNENSETAQPDGVALGREVADLCRSLDPTRPVTTGVNLMLNGLATFGVGVFHGGDDAGADDAGDDDRATKPAAKSLRAERELGAVGSAFFNQLMNRIGPLMNSAGRLRRVDRATRGICDVLDVAGYNYGSGAYRVTGRRHPGRVVVGSETLPGDIVRNWQQVETLPYLIGDFMWTAWDYLGEAGIGAWTYGADRTAANTKRFPYALAGGGAIDVTGRPGALAFHAQAAWGMRVEPAIVVRPLDHMHERVLRSPWRTTDGIASWSWPGFDGTRTGVVVFSAADEVELLLDGRSLGRRPAGRAHDCLATFEVTYHPGELTAVARTASGTEIGRSSLASAGRDVRLRLRSDRTELDADGQDLAFVEVVLADESGTCVALSGVALHATVSGVGSLAGFGSAEPKPTESYTGGLHRTYYGRALAVVRTGLEPGETTLTVIADGYGSTSLTITAAATGLAAPRV